MPAFAITAAAMGAMPFVKDYVGSVVLAALIGFIGTTASGSVFGMASVFAPRHISAVMTGQVRARDSAAIVLPFLVPSHFSRIVSPL